MRMNKKSHSYRPKYELIREDLKEKAEEGLDK